MIEIRKPLIKAISGDDGERLWVCERLFNLGRYVAISRSVMMAWLDAHTDPIEPPTWAN